MPRKFKIAMTGASNNRAATEWHDVGLRLKYDEHGALGFRVTVGGGMGRTPVIGAVLREFLPWQHVMNYIEAVVRVYNQLWKARQQVQGAHQDSCEISEGQQLHRRRRRKTSPEQIVEHDGGPHTIPPEGTCPRDRLVRGTSRCGDS